jgi:hypothetical protein
LGSPQAPTSRLSAFPFHIEEDRTISYGTNSQAKKAMPKERDTMTQTESQPESFKQFKDSFSYGTRSDMNFKFIKNLSDEDAALFLEQLLHKLGESCDDGKFDRVVQHVYEWQVRGYTAPGTWAYPDVPFAPLKKPVAQTRLTLVTSSGHFVHGDDPEPFGVKNMTQKEAMARIDEFIKTEPVLSAIPIETPRARLRVRHAGYDIHGAEADPNVALPLERLRELQKEGVVGEIAPVAYSFVGATAQIRLLRHSGPQWIERFKQEGIEAALLIPV